MYSPEDQTAKAKIRDAAIVLFGRYGPDAVSLRAIADAAAVSQPLIIKHFGSRAGLIKAADEHVLGVVEHLLHAEAMGSGSGSRDSRAASVSQLLAGSPIAPYLTHLLTDGRGQRTFKRLAAFAQDLVAQLASKGMVAPGVDHAELAIVLLVHDLAPLLLRAHIVEATGLDPLGRQGVVRWSETARLLYAGEALVDADHEFRGSSPSVSGKP